MMIVQANGVGGRALETSRGLILIVLLTLATTGVLTRAVYAADTPVPETSPSGWADSTLEQVTKTIASLRQRIEAAKASETDQTAAQLGVDLKALQSRAALLQSTAFVYEQLRTALQRRNATTHELQLTQDQVNTQQQKGITLQPPFNLGFYDGLLGNLDSILQQKEINRLAVSMAERSMADAEEKLESAQKNRRVQKELIESSAGASTALAKAWQIEQLDIELEYARAVAALENVNLKNARDERHLAELRQTFYQMQVNWVEKHLEFDEADLQKQIAAIDVRQADIKKRLGKVGLKQKEADSAWLKAQKKVSETPDPTKASKWEAMLKARDAWRKAYQLNTEMLSDSLRLLDLQKRMWRYRYDLIKGETPTPQLENRRVEIQGQGHKISDQIHLQQQYQNELQSQLNILDKQLNDGVGGEVRLQLASQVEAIQAMADGRADYISTLLETHRMHQRFLDEIHRREQHFSFFDHLLQFRQTLSQLWDLEVWVIDDRPVTLRKIVIAVSILIIGILLTRYLMGHIGRRLTRFTHIKATTASAVQKIFSYSAFLLILLFALRMVNIPLEAFAFLGGAVAIGVGFGAQNLINNFISGFIIMGERPINIGDLIEIEGVLGRVEEIGARCTRVRTGENIDILVPNSSFLEKNITNWTLTDRKIRTQITVGVAYGSPVREVESLLIKAVVAEEATMKSPDPFVIFTDFGDNALIFNVYFWINIQRIVERRIIESHVRFRIEDLFRHAGITIAFPQRDVHLAAQRPLELVIKNADSAANPPDQSV